MKVMLPLVTLFALCFVSSAQNAAEKPLTPKEAKSKVGETVTLEGKVAEVNKTDKVIRLNLGSKFPKQDFTLVIFPGRFDAFPDVEKLDGKTVQATGKVTEYRGQSQIILDKKEQLKVVEKSDEKK